MAAQLKLFSQEFLPLGFLSLSPSSFTRPTKKEIFAQWPTTAHLFSLSDFQGITLWDEIASSFLDLTCYDGIAACNRLLNVWRALRERPCAPCVLGS